MRGKDWFAGTFAYTQWGASEGMSRWTGVHPQHTVVPATASVHMRNNEKQNRGMVVRMFRMGVSGTKELVWEAAAPDSGSGLNTWRVWKGEMWQKIPEEEIKGARGIVF